MRPRWCRTAVAAAALTLAGCVQVSQQRCDDATQCVSSGVAGRCELDGYCSFPDDVCGWRYGVGAGPLSNQCVPGPDAAVDAPPIPIDAPPPDDDGDRDGIRDGDDNCPAVANADQHDEDGDLLGDVCDLCPHVADPMQVNSDGDGLGDVCDPRPGNPRNQLVLFDGFGGAGLPPWIDRGGAWSRIGDGMRVVGGDTLARIDRPITVPPGMGLVVETRVTISAVATDTAVTYAGLADPIDFLTGAGRGCALYDDLGNSTSMEAMFADITGGTFAFNRAGLFGNRLTVPITATILHTRTGIFRCDVDVGSDSKGTGYSGTTLPITTVGLFSRNATASYAYVFAYTD